MSDDVVNAIGKLGFEIMLAAVAVCVTLGYGAQLIADALKDRTAKVIKALGLHDPDEDDQAPGESTGLFPRLHDQEKDGA